MDTWSTARLAEQQMRERRGTAGARRTVRAATPGATPRSRATVWCGETLIGLGCRLVRPTLVAGTGA
jgi:hypothetical protein